MYISLMYFILFLLSLIALNRMFVITSNRRASYYAVLFTLITVVCLAYFSYSISLDKGMALVSNQFSYLDGTFVMMFFIFCILDIMGIRINVFYASLWTIINTYFLLIPFTAGHNELFYKSFYLKKDYGASHLVMDFGPLHSPFLIYIIINMLLPIVVVIFSFFYKKKISYKISITLSGLLVAIISLYFIQQTIGLGFDLLPCGYVLIEYVILGIIQRISLYDVNKIAFEAQEADKDYGCIIFSKKYRFAGASDMAKYYFPELELLGIDREVQDKYILEEFIDWLKNKETGNYKIIDRKDKKILCTSKIYKVGKKEKEFGYIIELRDDTEQQKLIEVLNETNEDLAQNIEIANNANRAKSQFLANMSHEIRTPINAILGMNELAMRQCNDPKILECMHNIENAGHNLMGIINDILDFSKIEAGKIEIINDNYDTAKLIKEIEDLIRIKSNQKSLNFIVNADEKLPSKLFGDENRIRQIIINILNNAIKYTHQGSVTFDVYMDNTKDKKINLCIKVSDTGIGIREEDIERLFSSFSRLEEKKNKNIEGTGLGLAITHKLIKLMEGDINVSSKHGEGSTFLVTIPQLVVDITPIGDYKEKYRSTPIEKESIEIDASGKNILVVDDNLINLKISEGLLAPTNATVTICENSVESLKLMNEQYYDIVILDHMMPEMDGIEVLKVAKSDEKSLCRNSTFIVLTANAINGVQDEYAEAGFNDYLSKPIDPVLFIKTIGKYV